MGRSGQRHAPAALQARGKEPIVEEAGWELNIILKEFYEKLSEHLNFHLDWTILMTTLHKSMNTLLTLFQIIAKNAAYNYFSLPE
jgi:uncharacterized membrane protein